MQTNRSIVLSFVLLVLMASLYRIIPDRPLGFAPQIAMAVFSGSIIRNKKYSFLLPLGSMLLSDLIYAVLHRFHLSTIPGFYDGQAINYALFALLTVIGFAIQANKVAQIIGGSIAAAVAYFLLSNTVVWASGGLDINNVPYPTTWSGWMSALVAGIPFFQGSLAATFVFSGLLFGGYQAIQVYEKKNLAIA